MIYSGSGVAEFDAVFTMNLAVRGEMTWIVTGYDPPEHIQ